MDTSRLEKSVSYITYPATGQVDVGTEVIYGRIHQEGGVINAKEGGYLHFIGAEGNHVKIKSVTIQKRAYLGINDQDGQVIIGIVQQGIRAAFKGA
jgi:phage gpG-like protein